MKSAIILALILASVLAVNILSIETDAINSKSEARMSRIQKANNLQIDNYTGSGIKSQMVRTFVTVINDAYTYYGKNIQDNAVYIQNKLEGSYTGKFQVLILSENSTADLTIYASSSGEAFVTWSKVNTAQPAWSYIIAILGSQGLLNTKVNGYYQVGSGISDSIEQVIQMTILKHETGTTCSCSTRQVNQDLEDYDGNSWNVACSSPYNSLAGFKGLIYQRGGIYTQTVSLTKGNCRYLVWVI